MVAFDLIVFAVIAAGLILWLKNVLGTRHGSERDIPNPYVQAANDAADAATDYTMKPLQPPSLNPIRNSVEKNAQAGLSAIEQADKSFDLVNFIQGAEKAFPMIVEAFAAGDRRVLKKLLSPGVFADFESAIIAREVKGHTQLTDIHSVRRADIIDARFEQGKAFVEIRFLVDETAVTKDSSGTLIAGDPDRIIEVVDVWVFGRDIKSPTSIWQVVETRDDKPEPAGSTPVPDSKS